MTCFKGKAGDGLQQRSDIMTTMQLPGAAASAGRCAWLSRVLVVAALMVSWPAAAQEQEQKTPQAAGEQPITAVYKAQEFSFQYRNSNRLAGCHELEQRVANILLGIGARDDMDVDVRNCDVYSISGEDRFEDDPVFGRDPSDPFNRDSRSDRWGRPDPTRDRSVTVRVRAMFPVEVTQKILDELEKDKSRRELVSRVTRNPAASFNEPVVFAATRQEVTLSRQTIRLKPEDCGLLDQMSTQVFRRLDVRVVRRGYTCNPRASSNIPPQLTVEALLPTGQLLPMPEPESNKTPGASGSSAPQQPPPPTEPAPQ
jgi:hypothetical protein